MLAKDKMPFSTVEKEGFNTFIKYAIPLYKIPDRKTITSLMGGKNDVLSNMIKDELSAVKNIAITTDIWKDTLNAKSFLGVTTHFIRGDEYKSIVIGVIALSSNHTAEYIKDWLLQTVREWKISLESIVVIVSDNRIDNYLFYGPQKTTLIDFEHLLGIQILREEF